MSTPTCCPSRSEDPRQAAARQSEVMRAFAEGKLIESDYHRYGKWIGVSTPSWDWSQYDYRIKVSPLAPGHNPDGLTTDQVGQGYRLLTAEEVVHQTDLYKLAPSGATVEGAAIWMLEGNEYGPVGWKDDCGFAGGPLKRTYRTAHSPGHYLPKVAEGHNPDELTDAQVETHLGWRLISIEENAALAPNWEYLHHLERWERSLAWSSDTILGGSSIHTYRTKKPIGFFLPKPKLASGHNPFELTETEVGTNEGWRLLEKEEIGVWNNVQGRPLAESAMNRVDHKEGRKWYERTTCEGWIAGSTEVCYRTKKPVGHFLPPALKRVPLTMSDIPAVCWMRRGAGIHGLVLTLSESSVWFRADTSTYDQLMQMGYEYSSDRINWKPCFKEVQS